MHAAMLAGSISLPFPSPFTYPLTPQIGMIVNAARRNELLHPPFIRIGFMNDFTRPSSVMEGLRTSMFSMLADHETHR